MPATRRKPAFVSHTLRRSNGFARALVLAGLLLLPVACRREHHPRRPAGHLVIAVQDDGRTLDPHEAVTAASMRLIENMYSTLLRYGRRYGEVEPDLAEHYDVTPDGLSYSFQLRPARFHSGRDITADDVVYSLRRIGERLSRADHVEAIDRVETPDPLKVVIHLRQPFAPFLVHLAHPMNAIVDRGVVEASGGSLRNTDAGSGPFKLVEWRRGRRLVLERFDDYHRAGQPLLRRVTFRPISDETARSIALRRGEVDLVLDVAEKDLHLLEQAPHVHVGAARPGTFWEYLGFNTRRTPFADARVRQAIAWALDRELLNRIVKLGRATILDGGHIRPDYWAHADLSMYPAPDHDRARRLLSAAGYPQGFSATLKVGSAFRYQVDAAQAVKQQLHAIGIDVHLQAMESSLFFDALARGDFDMTLVGWVGFVDPDEWTYDIFHSTGCFNQQGYANPIVDDLLVRGRRTMGQDDRRKIYREVQRLIAEDAPMAFLYLNDQTSAWLNGVKGYVVHATATTLSLRQTWVER